LKAIDQAKKDTDAEVIMGGNYDKSKGGYFKLQLDHKPKILDYGNRIIDLSYYLCIRRCQMAETLELVDTTSEYALTGAVFSQDRYAIEEATVKCCW
jgi:1-pyrroline-5-carboxylate dehydrogenase